MRDARAFQPAPGRLRGERLLVVYLAWAGGGEGAWRRFLGAYRRLPAGAPHDLLVVRKGFSSSGLRRAFAAVASGIELALEDDPDAAGTDIGAFLDVLRRHERPAYLFLGAFAHPLAAGWLGRLDGALRAAPRAGLVAATGSWESGIRRDAFPNPHARTTCFLARREVLEALRLPPIRGKHDTWAFEHGPASLTAQVRAMGLEAYVAGRRGPAFPPGAWPESGTYLSGAQANLLVGDQRTALAAALLPEDRADAVRRVWGDGGGAAALRSV